MASSSSLFAGPSNNQLSSSGVSSAASSGAASGVGGLFGSNTHHSVSSLVRLALSSHLPGEFPLIF
jgi:hypothetical protein